MTHKYLQLKNIIGSNVVKQKLQLRFTVTTEKNICLSCNKNYISMMSTNRKSRSCDLRIEDCLSQFNDKIDIFQSPLTPPKHIRHKPQGNEPNFDLRTHLYRMSGVDFTQVDGLGVLTVQIILSEIGLDPSRFPTVKHFTSWLGLCPGSRITGGKIKSSQTRPVVNRAEDSFPYGSANCRKK
jgi:Transposase IS116/IS110/IS902 family